MIQVLLMVMIILTGNYNFFNWLTIALCFSLLDDNHLNFWSGKRENTETGEFCYVCHGNVLSCRSSVCDTVCQYSTLSVHSFIHSDHFYRASSSPLLLRSGPDTARILCRSFTPNATGCCELRTCPRSLHGG